MAEKAVYDAGGGSGISDSETPVSDINERSLLRKLDLRLLPAVGVLYLLSFLDRSNGTATTFDKKNNNQQHILTLLLDSR